MQKIALLFLFVLAFVIPAKCQPHLQFPEISFEGLRKSKAAYLLSLLETKGLPSITEADILHWQQVLRNQSSIFDAKFRVDTVGTKQKLIFEIEENRTLFPIFNFGGVKNNFWYQLGFNDINWLGRGMQLSAYYRNNDRRHNFQLFYKVPQIRRSKWGGSISLLKWASVEPLYFEEGAVFYEYDQWSAGAAVFYQPNSTHSIEIGGNYFIEEYRKSAEQDLELTPGPEQFRQPKYLGKVQYSINKVNYDFFRLEGFGSTTTTETVFNTIDQTWFFIVLQNFTYYRRLHPKGDLAVRMRLGLSSNQDSPFAPFVLDSNVNIRGSGNRIDRGTAQVVVNLEYRHVLWNSKQKPFALQGVTFLDMGTWRNPGGSLRDLVNAVNFRPFAGGGLRLIYKKAFNTSLRVDYGIDIKNPSEQGIVLGIGQYF